MIEVAPLEPREEARYTALQTARADAMLYQSLAYRGLLTGSVGGEPHYLAARSGDRLLGVLPSFWLTDPALGCVANSLPFYGSHGGAVLDPALDPAEAAAVRRALIDAFHARAREARCLAATLIESPGDDGSQDYARRADLHDARIGQIARLPAETRDDLYDDPLIASFHVKTRNAIRKAHKEGLRARLSRDDAAWARLEVLHRDNLWRLGGTPKPPGFFAAARALPEPITSLWIAERGDQIVAALLLFRFAGTVEYFVPASDPELRAQQPGSLLVYRSMQAAIAAGAQRYNFGGTWNSQDGVYRFKARFGAEDVGYRYHTTLYRGLDALRAIGRPALAKAFPGYYVLPYAALDDAGAPA